MDFCKVCGKLAHRLVNDKRCQKCRKEGLEVKTTKKPKKKKGPRCKMCNKERKVVGDLCNVCDTMLKTRSGKEHFCWTCKKFKSKGKFTNKNQCNSCYNKEYLRKNPNIRRYNSGKRRATKVNATPKWLTPIDELIIKHIYETCPKDYHVDHIVPLNSKFVCGLHVPWNLRQVHKTINHKKSNRYWPNMWPETP